MKIFDGQIKEVDQDHAYIQVLWISILNLSNEMKTHNHHGEVPNP